MTKLPAFDDLPSVEGRPQGNTWGLWGKDDQVGTHTDGISALNLLSPDVVRAAGSEIKCGKSVSLDMSLDHFPQRSSTRRPFRQDIVNYHSMFNMYVLDDEIHFNTQSSSQWDGMTHCATQKDGYFYNGLTFVEAVRNRDGRNGIQTWLERGGIVGRGVLLDYPVWRHETGQIPVNAASSHAITVDELDQMIRHFKIQIRQGDILLLRTGYSEWYNSATKEERNLVIKAESFIGVEESMQSVRWLWNNHFAAVATDAPGFEVCPVPWGDETKVVLHEWILVHFGMPLGELWNLENLSTLCQEQERRSFFFTSAPLNVKGGVASPPNALAVL